MAEALLLAKAAHPQGPFGDFETCHRNTRHNRDPEQQILIPDPRHRPVQRLNKLLTLNIARIKEARQVNILTVIYILLPSLGNSGSTWVYSGTNIVVISLCLFYPDTTEKMKYSLLSCLNYIQL